MNNLGMFYKPIQGFAGSIGHTYVELFEYDASGNLLYYGVSNKQTYAAMGYDPVWHIARYYYDASNGVTQVSYWHEPVAWADRGDLDWQEVL